MSTKPKDHLTPKQERFVQNLIAGMSQRAAYRAAYPASGKWQDSTVDKRASELSQNGEVLGRYESLTAELAERVLWDRERATQILLEALEVAASKVQMASQPVIFDGELETPRDVPRTATKAVTDIVAELNRMFRINEAVKDGNAKAVIVDDL